jgi:cadmium resistance protein CadD (predicted permease)
VVEALLGSVAAFVATGLDEAVVLTALFAHARERRAAASVYAGQLLGQSVLVGVSVLAALGVQALSPRAVGLLGVVPIVLGVRILLGRDREEVPDRPRRGFLLAVAAIAVAGGGEEVATYVPLLGSLDGAGRWLAAATLLALVPVWCRVCHRAASVPRVQALLERDGRIVVPVVLIGLGAYVVADAAFG